ncbi:hypothetical protein [Candidatus Uabimicrobium amorphum]|uniref:GTPase n=1 Tax=Uabimicrobium amorphum TaxID=2596890 RepID=A0A5S9F515_UABAM|nr:hypothetical protein [Candidatus Uabimicrobium amorphum]BBM85683.1 GTPase [Candidatus Uabimicrobium amorphum]
MKKNICIVGNNGKEFHLYSLYYKKNKNIVFFAANCPEKLIYPFAGDLYPQGIPILPLKDLNTYIEKYYITDVVFAGSNVSFEYLSVLGQQLFQRGVDLRYSPVARMMLKASKKTIAVCNAVPNVCNHNLIGAIAKTLQNQKLSWLLRPYNYTQFCAKALYVNRFHSSFPPAHQRIQSIFRKFHHNVITGNDFRQVLREGEKQGNFLLVTPPGNDIPFVKPDIYICVLAKNSDFYQHYPGRINVEMANVIVVSGEEDESQLEKIRIVNPNAHIIKENDIGGEMAALLV